METKGGFNQRRNIRKPRLISTNSNVVKPGNGIIKLPSNLKASMLPPKNDLKQSKNTPLPSQDIENQREQPHSNIKNNPLNTEAISQTQSSSNRFLCLKCKLIFNDKDHLVSHLKSQKTSPHTAKDVYPMLLKLPVNSVAPILKSEDDLKQSEDTPLALQDIESQKEQPDSKIEDNPLSTEAISQTQSVSERFSCPECGFGFTDEYLFNCHLKSHKKSSHTDEDLSPELISNKNEQHDSKIDDNQSSMVTISQIQNNPERFSCTKCKMSFKRKFSLDRHLRVHENKLLSKVVNREFSCPDCSFSCEDKKILRIHFMEHGYDLTVHENIFDSIDEFNVWKEEISLKDKAIYMHKSKSNSKSKKNVKYLRCHRDGFYKPCGNKIRRLKKKGSNKINGHCPAYINFYVTKDGRVRVSFCLTHVGHDNEPERLILPKKIKEYIRDEIIKGVSWRDILSKLRDAEYEGGLKRLNFLKRQDLQNIVKHYNLQKYWVDKNDGIREKTTQKSSNVERKKRKRKKQAESAELPANLPEYEDMIELVSMFNEDDPLTEDLNTKFEFILPEFEPGSDAKTWVATVEIIFGTDPPKGAMLVATLANALKGEATAWLLSVVVPDMEWSTFRELFLAQYTPETLAAFLLRTRTNQPKVSLAAHVASRIASTMAQFEGRNLEEIVTAIVLADEALKNNRLQPLVVTKEITTSLEAQKHLQEFSMRLPFTPIQSNPNAVKIEKISQLYREFTS